MKNKPKYVESMRELAEFCNCSERKLFDHLKREGSPGKTKGGKYNVGKWGAYVANIHKERAARMREQSEKKSGTPAKINDTRIRKAELECEILEQKLLILKGEHISLVEHHSELAEHCAIMTGVFTQFKDEVKVRTKNPRLVKRITVIVNNALKRIRDRVSEAEERVIDMELGK